MAQSRRKYQRTKRREIKQEPQACPVCGGRMTVPQGFYAGQTRCTNAREPCRTCQGTGVVTTRKKVTEKAAKR